MYRTLSLETLRAYCRQVFSKYGFSEEESLQITDVLLTADLYGIESHGVQRLIRYHNAMEHGEVDVSAKPEILHETPLSAVLHARKAMGQLVSTDAMKLAIEKARQHGIGMVAVRGSNHYGIAGYYANMAAEQDLIGICMTNTEAIMVPTFGRKAMIGTNPIALAMPADPIPFLFDAATTVVPRGKLEVYAKKKTALPSGWAVDETGADNSSATDVLEAIIGKTGGGILPLGGYGELNAGHKGYGLGVIVELLTSVMSGGPTSNHAVTDKEQELSHCFWAVDYGLFGDKKEIKARFSTFLHEIRDSDKATGQSRVYIHGEKELESKRRLEAEGIPVNDKTCEELRMIGDSLGVFFPEFGD